MGLYPEPMERLIEEFRKLPSIGRKTAQRLALYVVNGDDKYIDDFAAALEDVRDNIHKCEKCGNITEFRVCSICDDPIRDSSTLCVVEDVTNLLAIEKGGSYKGKYFVLNGLINPMSNYGSEDIGVDRFIKRLNEEQVKEIIFAISPTVEGETTMLFLREILKDADIKITRIASGIPVGGNLEYYDELTLLKALEDRRDI